MKLNAFNFLMREINKAESRSSCFVFVEAFFKTGAAEAGGMKNIKARESSRYIIYRFLYFIIICSKI